MKIVKIAVGALAALWGLGILLKLLFRIPVLLQSPTAASYVLGALAGLIVTGLIAFLCFKSAFAPGNSPKLPR